MRTFILRRLLQMIPVFFGITFVSFLIVRLAPGDPIATMFPPEVLDRVNQDVLREQLGLNDPLPVQYVKMMGQFASGELMSFQERLPTWTVVTDRLPITLLFSTMAIVAALAIGLPIALISAMRPYSKLDNLLTVGSLAGVSIPQFWLALVLILVFSEQLRILPATGIRPVSATGYDLIEMFPYLIMPTAVMTLGLLPSVIRYTRSSLIDVLRQDYIRTARSKGMAERRVITFHALRNALIPVVSVVGSIFPVLLGGAVLVETIFGIPGLGRLAVRAAQNRDFPLVLTLNMFAAALVLISNFVTDLIYTRLDPRIRLE